jgi:hypothetical protein
VSAFDDWAADIETALGRMKEGLAVDVCRAQCERFVEIERIATPKRSGALAESERIDALGGSGVEAHGVVSPHKIYAEIRNYGGTISAKGGLGRKGKRPHTLHFGDAFPMTVHQKGDGYVQRAEGAARGAMNEVGERVLAWYLDGV